MLKFFDWAYKTGANRRRPDYASLPDSVVEQVRAAWKTKIKTVAVSRCTNKTPGRVRCFTPHPALQNDFVNAFN
ncbi:hypothetical protein ACNKHV_23185 [Shigella flexneri]